ncbi:MAG: XRE family transcriptional regulator [Peptococcaceae bacterium]|jgi:repressor LexA|nr:helix-turn-helix domain-containing protein [Peptococcaceae bacterium]MDH7526013.1 XRE family transcriptional regulator [Peptococcaceae bacterium]
MSSLDTLGDRIKYLREIKFDISMAKLGKAIGASSSNISDWENNKTSPSAKALLALCNFFDVSADWLLTGMERKSKIMQDSLYSLISTLPETDKEEVESYIRYLIWKNETTLKKKAAQQELPMVKETIYEYLPLIGRAAAGKPILIDEMVQGYIPVEAKNHQYTNCYLIEAVGDSMIGEGIEDGDLVIVRPQPAVDNGDVTLVRIDDEATIKYFHKENDVIFLKSANPKYDPMKFSIHDNIAIIGKVIETLKKDALNQMIIPETEDQLKEYKKGLRVTVKDDKTRAG